MKFSLQNVPKLSSSVAAKGFGQRRRMRTGSANNIASRDVLQMGADIIYVQSERYNKAFGDRRTLQLKSMTNDLKSAKLAKYTKKTDRTGNCVDQEPTDTSKQPIRSRYLGHLTGNLGGGIS
eukprot:sb/3475969/